MKVDREIFCKDTSLFPKMDLDFTNGKTRYTQWSWNEFSMNVGK